MTVRLNHTIVAARDKNAAALFMTEILGLPPPSLLGPFAVVKVSDDTSLDFIDSDGEIVSQHYAFLVSEAEFDAIFARIRERRLRYWADPYRHESDQINTWDDGRGLYFDDPNGHLLEIITRPYGSGGTSVSRPHPLVAQMLEPAAQGHSRSGNQGKSGGGKLAAAERPGAARQGS
jgi:catechol 2,3-dioxygenase-like lactoylglutathione lyase family enzyme